MDPLVALCLEPAYVAIHCIRESNVRYGDRVAVIGLGALGLLAVSIAREAGAELIIAADLLPQRRALAAEVYGADYTFDPRAGDLALQSRDLTDGMGVDVAIELTGAYIGLNTAISLYARRWADWFARPASIKARRKTCSWAANGITIA